MSKTGYINLDEFFEEDWNESQGNRVFRFDAFLSHRQYDQSYLLQNVLVERGLKVWHDNDSDIRDRRVQQKVARAIEQSRFVIVCVSKNFNDSVWCRAEFLPALELQQKTGVNCVLVALLEKDAEVPFELSQSPIFDVSDGSIEKLTEYLQSKNNLPFSPSEIITQEPSLKQNYCKRLLQDCQSILAKAPDKLGDLEKEEEVCAALASIIFESAIDEQRGFWGYNMRLYGLREMAQAKGGNHFRHFSYKTLRLFVDLVLWFADSRDSDNRANAMYLLVWLSRENLSTKAIHYIFEFLRREKNPHLVRIGVDFLVKAAFRKTKKRLSILALSALRDSYGWSWHSRSEIFKFLPESIRVFVLKGKGLNEELLSMEERLFLVQQRLQYLLESEPVSLNEKFDNVRSVFQISDVEITIRELHGLLFEYGQPCEFNNDQSNIYSLVSKMLSDFVQHSLHENGQPLVFMDEYTVDYLLPSLLICLRENKLAEEVRETYLKVCEIMLKYSRFGNEVGAYLHLLEIVENQKHTLFDKAFHDFTFQQMMNEARHQRRVNEIRGDVKE